MKKLLFSALIVSMILYAGACELIPSPDGENPDNPDNENDRV